MPKTIKGESLALQHELLALIVTASHWSTNMHVPKQAVLRKIQKDRRGAFDKGLKKLVRLGLLARHPTKGETTFQLTKYGLYVSSLERKDGSRLFQDQAAT